MLNLRKPWMPNDKKAKDLLKTDKLLFSTSFNPNQLILKNELSYNFVNQFGLPNESAKPKLKTLSRSATISDVILLMIIVLLTLMLRVGVLFSILK